MKKGVLVLYLIIQISISALAQSICETNEIYKDDTLTIYTVVEATPSPISGFHEYYKWINKNKNKRLAKGTKEQKRVLVEFIVHEDGSLSNLQIVKGLGHSFDQDAIKLVKSNPIKWLPGKCNGKKVKTKMFIHIDY